ncbi:putative sodium-coupled neutral amino acid transporter 11 [Limulus polyphemus]|uniref:Putative sodium-coupled neutral amino acid transporter 11 n=1 Tax=Limulus polyphemus TaxID=6850 RepID=A0ABM1S9X6_LIMPO|nr:putative sodium-coupled neutral amino acid transporter 11 [Limulus polyphemus]
MPETASILSSHQRYSEKEEEEDVKEQLNIPKILVIFANNILSDFIVGLPFAIQSAGLCVGILFLLLSALMIDYSLRIIILTANQLELDTYQAVIEKTLGRPGFYILTVINFGYPFLTQVGHNILMGDTITKIIRRGFRVSSDSIFADRNFIVFLVTVLVTLPLSLYRKLSQLSRMSFISLLALLSVAVFVIVRAVTMSDIKVSRNYFSPSSLTRVAISFAILACGFNVLHISFMMHRSLKNPTLKRWNMVSHLSVGGSCLVFLMVGLAGFFTFGDATQGDLLENYCLTDDWGNAVRFTFAVMIMLVYPTECFASREVIQNTFYRDKEDNCLRHTVITVLLVALAFLFSTLTDSFEIPLQVNGILTSIPLAYVLPALTYIRTEQGRLLSPRKLPAMVLVLLGCIGMICGTVATILEISNNVICNNDAEMLYCKENGLFSIANATEPTNETFY